MNTTNYIRIFRGDDSDALGYQTIVGTIKTDLDLTGCKAVFRFLGFYAEFDPIPEDKKLTIVIPAQASRGFPPGVGYASLKVFDSLGKIRTFTNHIPVIVDTMTPSCGCGEFEVSFSPFPELEPLKIFIGPNADDFDQYTGFISKIIDRASLVKYGLAILADAMSEDGGSSGKAASPLAVKAAYDAIIKELTDNYYTADETDEAINRVAAYYITYNAAGAAFPTLADLLNAQTYYSGGAARVPTRNDYAVVLADEAHGGAEWRYIYAVADGQTTGQWEPQYPVEGVIAYDNTVTPTSANGVKSSGIWSALWGALSALPTGFTSLYDWCVDQLAGKASTADATLTPRFTEWVISPVLDGYYLQYDEVNDGWQLWYRSYDVDVRISYVNKGNASSTSVSWSADEVSTQFGFSATRTALSGYQLGSQTDKPIASEAEADALRNGKLDLTGGTMTGTVAFNNSGQENFPALDYDCGYDGRIRIHSDSSGPYIDIAQVGDKVYARIYAEKISVEDLVSGQRDVLWPKSGGFLALLSNLGIPAFDSTATYAVGANVVHSNAVWNCTTAISTAGAWNAANWTKLFGIAVDSTPTMNSDNLMTSGAIKTELDAKADVSAIPYALVTKTISNNAVTLDDRASNAVTISTTLSPNTLTINFPTAPTGKLRDFAMRLNIAAGVTAPEIAWPQGVTLENNGGEVPEIADGGTGGSSTILYFSETENNGTTAKFLVKSETLAAITQA